jgi:hypothetical protein
MLDEDAVQPIVQTDEQPENLLEQLAAKRRDLADTKTTFIPVPGYDKSPPILLIQYRLLDGQEIERLGNKVRREFKQRWDRAINAAVDTIIAACTGLFIDKGDGSAPAPLTINGNAVLGFSSDLAEALGFADRIDNPDRARDVVFGLFANNDVAISQHNMFLNRWMTDTTTNISEEMYGGNF